MTRSLLIDAFDHHVWATLKVLDLLAPLSDEQLATNVPGTYGTILDTARHLVGADRWYLFVQTGGEVDQIDEAAMSIAELRAAMEPDGAHWRAILDQQPSSVSFPRFRNFIEHSLSQSIFPPATSTELANEGCQNSKARGCQCQAVLLCQCPECHWPKRLWWQYYRQHCVDITCR